MRQPTALISILLASACSVGDGVSSATCEDTVTLVLEELPEGCEDPRDYDQDGVMNCFDDDWDGDGLRNSWDRDPWDDGVDALRVGGTGADGLREIGMSQDFIVTRTQLAEDALPGDAALVVADADLFVAGQEVLVLVQQGSDAGRVHHAMVSAVEGATLQVEPAFKDAFSASDRVLVQRVPHYTGFTLREGAALYADAWDGALGGVIMFRAQGEVRIDGRLDLSGAGYRGGAEVVSNLDDPQQGESPARDGRFDVAAANLSGGGAAPSEMDQGGGGAGGGFGAAGVDGQAFDSNVVSEGGAAFGDAELTLWSMGGGGGSGAPDREDDGAGADHVSGGGGAGGGLLAVYSEARILVSAGGAVSADGERGGDALTPADRSAGEVGGGGGGAGGQLLLVAPELLLEGEVSALGGYGGGSAYNGVFDLDWGLGGDGGVGRVRLDTHDVNGRTAPDPEVKSFPTRTPEPEPYERAWVELTETSCSSGGGYFAGGAHGD